MVKCSVEECKSEAFKEGWCIDHYRKMKPPGGAGAPAKGAAGAGAGAGAPAKAAAPEVKAPAKAPAGGMDWQALQRMIFTRWVNQKIIARRLRINDVVTDLGTGIELVALIEVLSEKTCPKKLVQNPSMIQKLDNCSNALDFTWACGVTVELKPSAKNLLDGEPRQVLGLIWGIMRTFLKFSDDEDSKMSAPDALKMWVQNQVAGYKGVEVTNFTTSLHDGLALCALLHKFRPRLVPWETLDAKDWERNLNVAFDAAEKFFGLDKYLSAHDFRKLDDKSMVIYLSEYYYGVAAQRQKDLAARRIGKLITFTATNDRMKSEFSTRGARLLETMERAGKLLSDRTVDNTMEGAKKRLEDFNDYKNKDKGDIINDFLSIENLLSHLSMRLAEAKRPAFTPTAGLDVPGLRAALNVLEEHEKERKVALHAELNRQTKLANESVEHANRCEAVAAWGKDKRTYIDTKEESHSVSEAEYNLNKLSAFVIESEALQKGTVQEIKKLGRQLGEQKYENMAAVNTREGAVDSLFVFLNELATGKRARLEDDLAREKEKERVLAMNQQHKEKAGQLASWQAAKKSYLEFEEKINSVREAQTALTLVRAYASERDSFVPLSVPPLLTLGENIRNAEYKGLSSWRYEHPEEVTARERTVSEGQELLAKLYSFKLARLEDDLARESHKDKLRMWNRQHADRHKKLMTWINVQHKYLAKEEKVDSITSANTALNQLKAYEHEKVTLSTNKVKPLYDLGAEIIATKYDGASKWIWDTPAEIAERESEVAKNWEALSAESATKSARLNDNLVREKVKEKVRQWNAQHVDRHRKIASWVKDSLTYLAIEEKIDTISGAQLALTQLKAWEGEKKTRTGTNVKPLSDLGVQILAAEHKSDFSSWKWENAGEIKDRESWVETQWKALSDASAAKLARLEDDLAREKFNEELRSWNSQHTDKHATLLSWVATSKEYLAIAEKIDSISGAHEALNSLSSYEADKVDMFHAYVEPLKALGTQITTASYDHISKSKWNSPGEVAEREEAIDKSWAALAADSATKKARLDDDLAREKFNDGLRLQNADHIDIHAALSTWIADSIAYLRLEEKVEDVSTAQVALGKLASWEADKVDEDKGAASPLREKGAAILNAEYKNLTESKWTTRDEITTREEFVSSSWKQLSELSATKKDRLEDELAREEAREQWRLWNSQHIDTHARITSFVGESTEYLNKEEKVVDIGTAQLGLAQLTAYEAKKVDTTRVAVTSLKEIGARILSAEYKRLSAARWETPEEVKTRETWVDDQWTTLDGLSAKKLATLKASHELELKKENLRLTFAAQAGDFTLWATETTELAANSIFGFNLEEVERFDLKTKDAIITDAVTSKTSAWKGTFDHLTELKVTENVYTKLTPTELIAATATLNAALEVRSKRYEEEIGKRRVEDELCRAFAVLVEPFAKQIDADKDTVTKSSADLETQLADIEARIKAASAENKTLDEIKSAQARLDGAGIKNNRHTAVTARDLEAQWTQYVAFLNTKQTMLKDQIDAKKLRGVTPEQYAEIQSQFNQFDKDKSGKLDIGELRTCFYSLGNDFDKKQVDAIMTQYGAGEGKDRTISYERFKDFMIKQLGDTDTGDALLSGYDMVMRGAALGDTTQLDDCLNEEQVKYLREHAPRVATVKEGTSGSDYRAWIEASQR